MPFEEDISHLSAGCFLKVQKSPKELSQHQKQLKFLGIQIWELESLESFLCKTVTQIRASWDERLKKLFLKLPWNGFLARCWHVYFWYNSQSRPRYGTTRTQWTAKSLESFWLILTPGKALMVYKYGIPFSLSQRKQQSNNLLMQSKTFPQGWDIYSLESIKLDTNLHKYGIIFPRSSETPNWVPWGTLRDTKSSWAVQETLLWMDPDG